MTKLKYLHRIILVACQLAYMSQGISKILGAKSIFNWGEEGLKTRAGCEFAESSGSWWAISKINTSFKLVTFICAN